MIALEARSVDKVYGSGTNQVKAIDSVSFGVDKGEFVALVGPSGSGKTTMLAMLAGLLEPTSGSVLIEGEDLGKMGEAQRAKFRRRRIGFTFQANNLVSYLTALENVELMLRLTGQYNAANKERARRLLEMLGLEERMYALPRELSGGQQQRVAIARSLINNPAVVLADEPTASLDTERAYQVVETMAHLVHEQGRAGIIVTHDLRMVEYTDRIVHLLDGRLERIVSPDDDLSCLADPASCQMIGDDVLGVDGDKVAAAIS
jgi:putative ABC transport system ATP-binding protein